MAAVVLIDAGHGAETPGKCSPDRRLLEWSYNRRVARAVVARLRERGVDARLVVTEDTDVPLRERCQRVNRVCTAQPCGGVLLVSVHCNAAGADGRWHDARGWSVFVAPNGSESSRRLATLLGAEAALRGLQVRRPSPHTVYWTASLAMCRDTRCPAVLTENLFMDNKADVELLLSESGFDAVVALHVDAIISYLKL